MDSTKKTSTKTTKPKKSKKAKTSKSKKTTSKKVETKTTNHVPATAPATAPVTAPVTTPVTTPATAPTPTTVPAPATAPVPAPTDNSESQTASNVNSPVNEHTKDVVNMFDELVNRLQERISQDRKLLLDIKNLQKHVARERKVFMKGQKKRRKNNEQRAPSGFAKPTPLSNELADFLGVEHGTEMARTEVTKLITTYIKENNLQNPEYKKQILPDNKLSSLLYCGNDEVTYFNLQKYMKVHFLKKDKNTGEIAPFHKPTVPV